MEERKWNKIKGSVYGCKSVEGFTDLISDEERKSLQDGEEIIVITNVGSGEHRGVGVVIYYESTNAYYLFLLKDPRAHFMEGGTLLKILRQSMPLDQEHEDAILKAIHEASTAKAPAKPKPPVPPKA